LKKAQLKEYAWMKEGEDYTRTPSGDLFVTRKHRVGLLPKILEDLLAARKRAKTELKTEIDPFKSVDREYMEK
jgi:DNA polymerase delta subunit 1